MLSLAFPAALPAREAPANLMAGAKWEYGTDEGAMWAAAPPVVPGGKVVSILARTSFEPPDLSRYTVLELPQNLPPGQKVTFNLNGQPLPLPLAGMAYKTAPAPHHR